jgi:hypothetical protein
MIAETPAPVAWTTDSESNDGIRPLAKVHVTMTKTQGTGAGALPSVDSY